MRQKLFSLPLSFELAKERGLKGNKDFYAAVTFLFVEEKENTLANDSPPCQFTHFMYVCSSLSV
jgi:hypothetical protein